METRKPLDDKAAGLMLVLCLVWAMQQIALKATAAEIAPVFQLALRSGGGLLLVALLMRWRAEPLVTRGSPWRAGLLAGLLFSLEFLLVGEALRHTSAAHVVVFLYTAPVFAALGLHWRLPSERLGSLQWVGILLAFSGIAMAFFGGDQKAAGVSSAAGSVLWGDLLALLAGMLWGATTVVIRCSRLAAAPATQTLLYQLGVAFVMLSATSIVSGQTQVHFTPLVWASLAFQVLVVSFASFLAWFWLLRHYLAARLGVFTFLTPLLGIVLGAWLLGEAIERSFVLGAVPVLLGIALVSGHGWLASLRVRLGRRGKAAA
jgi:drug/metabolite transporter (DMT)-like permease